MHKCYEKDEIHGRLLHFRWDLSNYDEKHIHDFWEFMIIIQGTYHQSINDKEFTMINGDAILVKPNDVHQVFIGQEHDYHLNIIFSCDFLKQICDNFDTNLFAELNKLDNEIIRLKNDELNTIKNIISRLEIVSTNEEEIRLKKVLLSYIVEQVYFHYFLRTVSYPKQISDLIQELSSPKNISLKVCDIISMSNYSYSHLAKIFKEATGITLIKFITIKKMNYARDTLIKTDMPILELSNFLGYSSLSHFMSVFKNYFGTTPGKYRNIKI